MESYSIFPLLLMVYFVAVAAGCAELPQKALKRCPFLFYGTLTCATILFTAMFINLLITKELPEASCFEWYFFWPCCGLVFILTLVGMMEVSKRRTQKKLSSIEFCLSELFLSGSVLTLDVYFIYLLISRRTIF